MIFINYYQKCMGQPLRRKFYSDIPLFQTGSLQGSQQYSFSIPVGKSAGNFSSPAILELVMVVVRKSQEHLAAGLVMKENQDRHLFPPNTVVRFAERAVTLSFQSSRNYQDQHSSPKYSGGEVLRKAITITHTHTHVLASRNQEGTSTPAAPRHPSSLLTPHTRARTSASFRQSRSYVKVSPKRIGV